MAASSHRADTFDPRIAFPAATDSVLGGLRASFNHHIDWLDGYLQQVKDADVLRAKSANVPSRPPRAAGSAGGLWVDILKSPARKRTREGIRPDPASQPAYNGPIASLSYASAQSKQNSSIFNSDGHRPSGAAQPKGSSSSSSLSRSPAKTGLKSIASVSPYLEADKENAPALTSLSRSTSSHRAFAADHNNRSTTLNTSHGTPKRNALAATTAGASPGRSPGIRSPLQSSASKARQHLQPGTGNGSFSPSASAPASPLRSPGLGPQGRYQQSPLTRSQRLTQTTSSANASPSTSTVSSSAASKIQRPVSPSPTPRPATRTLRSPTAIRSQTSPCSSHQGRLLSPYAAGSSRITTPRKASGTHEGASNAHTSANTTPVRVVDDVFTLSSTADTVQRQGADEQDEVDGENSSRESEDMDDDEEEIENILLGYTKTPAAEPAKKVLKSDVVRHAGSDAVVPVVEIPIREKELPAIPQSSQQVRTAPASPKASIKAAFTRISPPRPTKSPARPATVAVSAKNNNNNKDTQGKGIIANISPSKITRPMQNFRNNQNHSPVKRDMSHLASIASMLSPSKPNHEGKQQQGSEKEAEGHSRPASPQLRSQSRVPVPQSSAPGTPARPRSPVSRTLGSKIAANASSKPASPDSRPTSPSRISSRIAALAGAARGNPGTSASISRESSAKIGSQPASPSRFGITRSPRLKQALRMESPASRTGTVQQSSTTSAVAVSGLPTPTKMKRPMLSPIQSPDSQRSLALSSLRKAVPGFETNSFSPPASPKLPSTMSTSSNIHSIMPPSSAAIDDAEKAMQIQKQLEQVEKAVQMQMEKDEDLIDQHARAISALGKSLPPPPSPPRPATAAVQPGKKERPAGLSPPAKSPLRKLNSKTTLAHSASPVQDGRKEMTENSTQKSMPTPSKDANETIMPQTVVKKVETDATVQFTAHKDSTVDLPPPSPVFSSFLANNANSKRPSTLSFAGLPGRTLGAPGREKSIGLGLGLGKSLGGGSVKDRNATASQAEDIDSQGSTQGTHRQSFYTAALASQSRKRLSSTIGTANGLSGFGGTDNADIGGNKASRTEFSNTARASILASQTQQSQQVQPMSHSARLDLLRSRISNIKGTTGYVPSSASLRTSFAASTQVPAHVHQVPSVFSTAKSDSIAQSEKHESMATDRTPALFSPPLESESAPTSLASKDRPALPTSATSTFASTIASFVPAPSFGASFASIFGAGAMKATKPDSPAKSVIKEPEADILANQKQPQVMLYPSLPSMNNLDIHLAPFSSSGKLAKKTRNEIEDEELVEELDSAIVPEVPESEQADRQSSIPPSPVHREKRSSSVLSIVSNIESKEAEARRERERQESLSPRKASGAMQMPAAQTASVRAPAPRSTTPTFSPPKQDALARLSTGHSEALTSSRPESRLSDMPTIPGSERVSLDLSIAGVVDIEDPGLDAIPRALSDELDIPTTDAASDADDEEMDEADDQDDVPQPTQQRVDSVETSAKSSMVLQQSAPAPKLFKPGPSNIGNLSKSTFKPSRPAKDIQEVQRPVHRPPSRAPSSSSLAPSRASTASLASSSYNPSRPGTAMSTASKKGNTSVSASTGTRPEIKSLANAAAAAKKEQAEKSRKAAIKEERDQKRAAFLAAKREEQDSQAWQASQGVNNGAERKRKERDDLNASQTVSSQSSTIVKVKTVVKATKPNLVAAKTDDEQAKKRKVDGVEVVVHKPSVPKTTVARPPQQKGAASSVLQASTYAKHTIASSSTTSNAKALAASSASIGITKQAHFTGAPRPPSQASTSKASSQPTKSANPQTLLSQHQQAILSASSAFGKTQASSSKAAVPQNRAEPELPEPEPFQLPEIDSEYSDSDEDVQAQKAALRPVWTHSPELRQALAVQAMFDPDQLFGEMPALKMEEIFKNPATMARLRHRTSSAHWSGPDAISRYEEKEYAKRMGFRRIEEHTASKDEGPSDSGTAKQ